jgi:hypothetical protein
MEKWTHIEGWVSNEARRSENEIKKQWLSMSCENKLDDLAGLISLMRAQLELTLGALEEIKGSAIPEGRVYAVAIAERAIRDCRALDKEGYNFSIKKRRLEDNVQKKILSKNLSL